MRKLSVLMLALIFAVALSACNEQAVPTAQSSRDPASGVEQSEQTSSTAVDETSSAPESSVQSTGDNGTETKDPAPESKAESKLQSPSKSEATASKTTSVPKQTASKAASGTAEISRDRALSIAYGDAGVAADAVRGVEAERDRDDGVPSWEIEFHSGNTEYKYDIHAETGTILERDIDRESGNKSNASKSENTASKTTSVPKQTASKAASSTAEISRDRALSIAYGDAGVTADAVRGVEAERDRDDGVPSWEIEFHSGNTEYKYDIHAQTGTILERDIDRDD